MPRKFTAAANNLNFGSNAAIDDFTLKSILIWVNAPGLAAGEREDLVTKWNGGLTPVGWNLQLERGAVGDTGHIRFDQSWSLTDGAWVTPNNSFPTTGPHAVAVTYDRGATGNDPNIYIDGVLQVEAELTAPTGATQGDAAESLIISDDTNGVMTGVGVAWFVYDNTIMTAADINRHRWWGRAPGGPSTVEVMLPMVTDTLTNQGTAGAVANATNNGSSMTVPGDSEHFVKVVR